MSNIIIEWRTEEHAVAGYVRIPAIGDMTVTDPRIFEIRRTDHGIHFQVFTYCDGALIGTAWRSINAAKRLALHHLYDTVLMRYGQPPQADSFASWEPHADAAASTEQPRRRIARKRRT